MEHELQGNVCECHEVLPMDVGNGVAFRVLGSGSVYLHGLGSVDDDQ